MVVNFNSRKCRREATTVKLGIDLYKPSIVKGPRDYMGVEESLSTLHCIRIQCRKNAYGQLKSCMYTISSTVKYAHTTGKTCTCCTYGPCLSTHIG